MNDNKSNPADTHQQQQQTSWSNLFAKCQQQQVQFDEHGRPLPSPCKSNNFPLFYIILGMRRRITDMLTQAYHNFKQ